MAFFRLFLACFLAFGALAATEQRAEAFPWMIRHDYKVCNACHADPSGSGLLTAYGRGMEEIGVRGYFSKHTGEEDPGKLGNFMFGAFDLPEWLLLQADGRTLMYANAMQKFGGNPFTTGSNPALYLMQANVDGQATFGRFRVNGDLGVGAPGGALAASVTRGDYRLISRQFWAGVDIGTDNPFLLRAGRMNVPFGLRIPEHTSFVRRATRTDINSAQEYGISLAYTGEKVRGEAMAIAGNFNVRPDDYRERGYAAYIESTGSGKATVGLSSMITHADRDPTLGTPLWRHAHGAFARWSPVKPLVLLAETDLLLFSQPPTATAAASNRFGNVTFVQLDIEPVQGFHFMPTVELLHAEALGRGTALSGSANFAWYFAPHADFRFDAVFQDRGLGTDNPSTQILLLAQLHFLL